MQNLNCFCDSLPICADYRLLRHGVNLFTLFLRLVRRGCKNLDALFALHDLTVKVALPRGITGNIGCLWLLHRNEQRVVEGIVVELGHRAEIFPVSYTHLDVYKRQVLEAPCRSSFDAAMALIGEHGGVKTHQTLPKDADALVEVLSKQKSRRDRLPEADRTEVLSPLPVAELRKYEAVKKMCIRDNALRVWTV